MAIAVLYREEIKEYDFGPGHPLRGDRFEIFPKFLKENLPEDDNYRFIKAEAATEADLRLICQQDYIDFTREYFRAANLGRELGELGRFSRYHSLDNLPRSRPGRIEEAARFLIGQVKMAADLVQAGTYDQALCVGGNMHHAKPSYGEGFCLYNDNAFVALYLMEEYGLERVLILDTDAHAGNGTAEYFYADPRVLFIDVHQDPRTLYPGTGFTHQIGSGDGQGFTINISLPPHAGYDAYKLAFETIIEPVTREFEPQIIVRNGGSDPHFADELTNLGLTVGDFRMIGEKVRQMAEICRGRVIDTIGSGYNTRVLPYAWLSLLSGLAGWRVDVAEPVTVPFGVRPDSSLEPAREALAEVKKQLKDYWACLR